MIFPKQVIFCVETKESEKSDCIYIKEIVFFYYGDVIRKNSVTIQFVFMDGKHSYKHTHKEVKDKIKLAPKATRVVFIFDKDRNTVSAYDSQFIKKVSEYCSQNAFDIVWFVKDIEDVMLGHNASKKTKEASDFKRKNQISKVKTSKLKNPNPQIKTSSNVLCILGSILGPSDIVIK